MKGIPAGVGTALLGFWILALSESLHCVSAPGPDAYDVVVDLGGKRRVRLTVESREALNRRRLGVRLWFGLAGVICVAAGLNSLRKSRA